MVSSRLKWSQRSHLRSSPGFPYPSSFFSPPASFLLSVSLSLSPACLYMSDTTQHLPLVHPIDLWTHSLQPLIVLRRALLRLLEPSPELAMIARVRPPHRLQLARHFRQLRKHLGRERVEELVGLDERFTRVLVGHDDGHFRDGRGEEGGGLLGGDEGGIDMSARK
jgi:hypothetical protein